MSEIINNQLCKINQSLEFFSQVMSLEQLSLYGLQILQNIFESKNCYMYILDEKNSNSYILKNYIGKKTELKTYEDKNNLNEIALLYGRTIKQGFDKYFNNEFINEFNIEIVLPIIIREKLYGFIIFEEIKDKEMLEDVICENIRIIMNMSFTNAQDYIIKKETAKLINKKIFNLMFINQSTKQMLSELNIDLLSEVCIDIIRELTTSKKTSFFIFDDIRNKMILRGFNDVNSYNKEYMEINPKTKVFNKNSIILDYNKDIDIISNLFYDYQKLEKVNPKYLILIVSISGELLGFVTISEPLNNEEYDKDILEQVEQISSAIYISLKNTKYIRKIEEQKSMLDNQLSTMKYLNQTTKNIFNCMDMDELFSIIKMNLFIGFGLDRFILILKENNEFRLQEEMNVLEYNKEFLNESDIENIKNFYDDNNTFLKIPLENTKKEHIGYIIIYKCSYPLQDFDYYAIDNIASTASSLLNHFYRNKI